MAKLLSGKEVAEAIDLRSAARREALAARGIVPTLATLRVGEDPGAVSYEKGICKRAEAVGIRIRKCVLPAETEAEAVAGILKELNEDTAVHGILLFRPLPEKLKEAQDKLCNLVLPEKDVDCMTHLSAAAVYEGNRALGFSPCTPEACMAILDHYTIDVCGKNAVVIGRSPVVGKPAAMMLLRKNATVTVCHTKTKNLPEICRRADILLCAAGHLRTVTDACVSPGQTVIDVSVNWDPEKIGKNGTPGALAGDADFERVAPLVDAITPVPGGVGAVTTSILMQHVVEAAERA